MNQRGHEVVAGGGAQTLRFTPRDRDGKVVAVASATYAVEDLRLSTEDAGRFVVAAGTAASVDSVSTTTSALAGRGASDPRYVAVADETGIVAGRTYLLTASDGRREIVVVAEVGSGFFRAVDEIAGSFAASSTLSGVDLTGTFPSSEADDETAFEDGGGPYLTTWTYTVGGSSESFRVPLFLVLAKDQCPATTTDMLEAEPLAQTLAGGRTPLAQYLRAGWWEFRAKCKRAGLDLGTVSGGEVAIAAIAHMAVAKLLRTHGIEEYGDLALQHDNDAQGYFDSLTTGKDPLGVVRVHRTEDQSPSGVSQHYTPRFMPR